ncbi:MAG: nuclear transport factor 2 family protein [Actinomycetota bacterium]
MTDRDDIIDNAITRLFWHADHHQWTDLRTVFADEVLLDYTSLQGGEPATVPADEVISGWRTAFEAIDAHQHLVANHLVDIDGDAAVVTAAFQATHQWRGETWTLGGDYRFEVTRSEGSWLITAMTMVAGWQTGPADLMARATAASLADGA